MTTFVLAHGAWHGGWCWRRVVEPLARLGHRVYAPSLTGLADRSHLLSRDVRLSTHVADVANLIRWEDLDQVVLCGHSYGGCVISGAAEQVAQRIGALVYLDALVLNDGESAHDSMPPEYPANQLAAAREHGDGWRLKPVSAEFFNVNPADRAWVDAMCTPHPLASFQEPLRLSEAAAAIPTRYIYAVGWGPSTLLGAHYQRAKDRGWTTSEADCGHDMMVDRPDLVVEALLAAASEV